MLAPGSSHTHSRGQTLAHTAPHPNAWKGFNSKVVFKKEEEAKASLANDSTNTAVWRHIRPWPHSRKCLSLFKLQPTSGGGSHLVWYQNGQLQSVGNGSELVTISLLWLRLCHFLDFSEFFNGPISTRQDTVSYRYRSSLQSIWDLFKFSRFCFFSSLFSDSFDIIRKTKTWTWKNMLNKMRWHSEMNFHPVTDKIGFSASIIISLINWTNVSI